MCAVENNKAVAPTVRVARPAGNAPTANTSKPAANAPASNRAADSLVTTRPGTAVEPTRLRLSASEQMKAERPKFKNPDDYKNYVIKFQGYIQNAKSDLELAKASLEAEKQKQADAAAEFGKPLRAAEKVMADTHALYQAPIDRINGELGAARRDLDNAIYPGKAKAAELDAEANRMAGEIDSLGRQIGTEQQRISTLSAQMAAANNRRAQAEASLSTAESEIRRLESSAPSQSAYASARDRVNSTASTLRDAQSRLDTANSRLSAKRDLESRISRLEQQKESAKSAESQIETAKNSAAGFKGQVTRTKNALDSAMAKGENPTAAKAAYDEAVSKYATAEQKVRTLESQIPAGGSAGITSQISQLKSQLSGYSGVESEHSSASSAVSSASTAHQSAKQRYDDMTQILNDLERNRGKRSDALRTIEESRATAASCRAQIDQGNVNVRSYQDQLSTKTNERNHIVSEANRERDRKNPDNHPQVVQAKARVETLTNDLNQAQATYNEKTAGPKAKVAEEKTAYTNNMKPFDDKVADATRAVTAATGEVEKVQAELAQLKKGDIGWFKKLWWKLWHHFDVDKFWKEQGNQILAAVQRDANSALA